MSSVLGVWGAKCRNEEASDNGYLSYLDIRHVNCIECRKASDMARFKKWDRRICRVLHHRLREAWLTYFQKKHICFGLLWEKTLLTKTPIFQFFPEMLCRHSSSSFSVSSFFPHLLEGGHVQVNDIGGTVLVYSTQQSLQEQSVQVTHGQTGPKTTTTITSRYAVQKLI